MGENDMRLIIKIIMFGIVLGIIYYLTFELHILELVLDYVSNFSKSFLNYASDKFFNMLGNLI